MGKKQYFIYGLNIIQLSIFFLLLITLIGSLRGYEELYGKCKDFFPEGKVLMYQGTFESMDYDREERLIKETDKIIDELIKEGKILFKFNQGYSMGSLKGAEDAYLTEVDRKFLEKYPLEIEVGRDFTNKELEGINDDIIPIIVGNGLKNKVKVGDVLERNIEEGAKVIEDEVITVINEGDEKMISTLYKFKVIGIAKPNTMAYLDSSDAVLSGYKDNMIYSPNYKEEIKIYKGEKLILTNKKSIPSGFSYLEFKTEKDAKEVMEFLNAELKKRDNLGYVYYPEKDNLTLKSLRERYITLSIFCGVFIIFSVIGVIGSMIYSIRESEKEYGILAALGATKKHLIIKNLIKIIGLLVISLGVALGITMILRNYILAEQAMTLMEEISSSYEVGNKYLYLVDENLIKNLSIALFGVFIVSSVPIVYKITKYNIVNLIRGK